MLLSLPTVIGNTTPGNKTVLRSGSNEISSGTSIFSLMSASFSLMGMMGKKSISSSGLNNLFTSYKFIIGKGCESTKGSTMVEDWDVKQTLTTFVFFAICSA